jgi:hypothetical protein
MPTNGPAPTDRPTPPPYRRLDYNAPLLGQIRRRELDEMITEAFPSWRHKEPLL